MESAGVCTYCGALATTRDHLTPVSRNHAARNGRRVENFGAVPWVMACVECNSILGDFSCPDVPARAGHIAIWISRRYAKALSLPDWAPGELLDVSENMRRIILGGLHERDCLRHRLAYLCKVAAVSS